MQYIQDYDEKFPPAFGGDVAITTGGTAARYDNWWGPTRVGTGANAVDVPGILNPYVKNLGIFRCASAAPTALTTYMYNDFLATKSQASLAAVADTVMVCDSRNLPSTASGTNPENVRNAAWQVGHSASADPGPSGNGGITPPTYTTTGNPPTRIVATGAVIPLDKDGIQRHSDGANFLRADGSVKWFKVAPLQANAQGPDAIPTSKVYFPADPDSRLANADAANPQQNEPVPGGNMGNYALTFHLR
jgi:prepilin-type processing-associated H-X9-DG protein